MELKSSGFFYLSAHAVATCKGHFLKRVCAAFTVAPLFTGYFSQNMCEPGKV